MWMTRMIDEQLDRAIGLFYGASMTEEPWAPVLSAVGASFSCGVYVHVFDTVLRVPTLAATSDTVDPDAIAAYEAHYNAIDPRLALALRLPVGGTLACHEHFDPDFVRTSEFYNDFLLRHGFRYAAGIRLLGDDRESAMLGFNRSSRQEPFTIEERQTLVAIYPHLARALRLRRALRRASEHAARRQAMLDRFHTAAFLVDASGQVLEHNLAAERLARDGDGLLLRHGRLLARRHDEAARLERLIKDAAGAACRQGAGGGACRLSRRDGGDYAVMVTPLAAETEGGSSVPTALVRVSDLDRHPSRPPQSSLRVLYGLTATEEALALALLEGRRLKEIAELRRVSLETVRVQLKALFAKTGCDRQADLARKLTLLGT
jgi:DNA-binding CsgD family transcriptional regulator